MKSFKQMEAILTSYPKISDMWPRLCAVLCCPAVPHTVDSLTGVQVPFSATALSSSHNGRPQVPYLARTARRCSDPQSPVLTGRWSQQKILAVAAAIAMATAAERAPSITWHSETYFNVA